MKRKAILLVLTMAATLLLASGVAFAVNKVCPPGTTVPGAKPCLGTSKTKTSSGNDLLIGTSGADYIKALSGNDKISAGGGNDTTDGGAGNDTYSYADGWSTDALIDGSGIDTLNFSAVSGGISTSLHPDLSSNPQNVVSGPNGERVDVSLSPTRSDIEKVVGSASSFDNMFTGGAANILQPGPGKGGGRFTDLGGYVSIPASNDTYSGLLASGFGPIFILDYGGNVDKLILPFASTEAYFEALDDDRDGSDDLLLVMSTSTDYVYLYGQLEPYGNIPGHIESLQFTDDTLKIGSASATTSASSSATSSSDSVASQVDALNEASTLSASKKDELKKAAKKFLSKGTGSPNES